MGVGDPAELTPDGVRRAAAAVARRSSKAASVATTLRDGGHRRSTWPRPPRRSPKGSCSAAYQYLEYKGDATPSKLRKVTVVARRRCCGACRGRPGGDDRATRCTWARDMVNTPSKEKSPADMVAAAAAAACAGAASPCRCSTSTQLEAQRIGGVLGVGQGSEQTPRFLKMTYAPAGARGKALALVGKGVVFDSGGLSLKTAGGMETMKTDMSGGAAVIAAMSALADARREDAGHRLRAAGREHAERQRDPSRRRAHDPQRQDGRGAQHRRRGSAHPRRRAVARVGGQAGAIVDLATLTGACVVALGDKIAGLMGNDDELGRRRCAAPPTAPASRCGRCRCRPSTASSSSPRSPTSRTSAGSYGGALTAGLFLQEFVDGAPWVHLDIAGPARANATTATSPRAAPGSACARWSSWRARSSRRRQVMTRQR